MTYQLLSFCHEDNDTPHPAPCCLAFCTILYKCFVKQRSLLFPIWNMNFSFLRSILKIHGFGAWCSISVEFNVQKVYLLHAYTKILRLPLSLLLNKLLSPFTKPWPSMHHIRMFGRYTGSNTCGDSSSREATPTPLSAFCQHRDGAREEISLRKWLPNMYGRGKVCRGNQLWPCILW